MHAVSQLSPEAPNTRPGDGGCAGGRGLRVHGGDLFRCTLRTPVLLAEGVKMAIITTSII